MRNRHAQRIDSLIFIQVEQMGTCQRHGKSQVGAACPPPCAEIGQPRILLKTRHDLITGHDRSNELFAAGAYAFGDGEDGRNIEARMTRIGARMAIHEIQKAKRSCVYQSRFLTRRKIFRSQNACLRKAAQFEHSVAYLPSRLSVGPCDHHAQRIEQTPSRLTDHPVRKILKTDTQSKIG